MERVEIVEEPEANKMRFRYFCEGRSAGSILGVNSTDDVKTYPAIRVLNYDGAGIVVVSCVAVDKYESHPNCLVGKSCKYGVYTSEFTTVAAAPTIITFQQLGIQIVKIADIAKNLDEREKLRIDPFKKGFGHKQKPKLIKLHQVRLCFQVLLKPDPTNPKFFKKLDPVVSQIIRDKHRTNMQLHILDVSDDSSPPCGGKKIMIFCDKVDKRDIRIRFYEKDANDTVVWEELAVFQPNNVHKQVAIAFKTPKYKVEDIHDPVHVFVRLETISDDTVSEAIKFQYVPVYESNNIEPPLNRKKRKIEKNVKFYEYLEQHGNEHRQRSRLQRNIDPNEMGAENIAPDNSNFIPSNFFASNNNIPPAQPQRYDNSFHAQSQHEQPFQQQPDRQQLQQAHKSDYQWPMSQPLQPLQNMQPQQVYHKQFENPQCEQYHQPQYHPMPQSGLKVEPNYGNYSSQYNQPNYPPDVGRNAYGAEGNLGSNNFSNFGRQSQPMSNYQTPNVDAMQMTYDAPTHQSCHQIGPVYAYDKVIIQQFVSNSPSFNQQPNVTETQNVGGCVNSDLQLL